MERKPNRMARVAAELGITQKTLWDFDDVSGVQQTRTIEMPQYTPEQLKELFAVEKGSRRDIHG